MDNKNVQVGANIFATKEDRDIGMHWIDTIQLCFPYEDVVNNNPIKQAYIWMKENKHTIADEFDMSGAYDT